MALKPPRPGARPRGDKEENIFNLAGYQGSNAAPKIVVYNVAPAPISNDQVPQPRVRMHADSSQIESILNPVRGPRDAQMRAGIKPANHARNNMVSVKEQSQINALRKLSTPDGSNGGNNNSPNSSPSSNVTKLPPVRSTSAPSRRPVSSRAMAPPVNVGFGRGGSPGPGYGSRNSPSEKNEQSGYPNGNGYGNNNNNNNSNNSISNNNNNISNNANGRDFVAENRAGAAAPLRQMGPRITEKEKESNDALKYLQKRDFGRIPQYLLERKLEMAADVEARERAKEAALIPPGMRLMPEEERLETLAVLKRNKEEIDKAIQGLPLRIETPGQIRRKDELESRLKEIDDAFKVFSRPKVLVQI